MTKCFIWRPRKNMFFLCTKYYTLTSLHATPITPTYRTLISYLYARSMRIVCLECNLSRRNVSWPKLWSWSSSWKISKLLENDFGCTECEWSQFTKVNLQNIACPGSFCISSVSRYILKSFVISIISPKSINKTLNVLGCFCEKVLNYKTSLDLHTSVIFQMVLVMNHKIDTP